MSSYRNHALAGIIMALPFAPSLFYLFFALIGASIPDMDHNNNTHKVRLMFIFGIILSIILFLFNNSIMAGLMLVLLALIFYFSKHRGFTHSIIGVVVLSFLFLLMFATFITLIKNMGIVLNYNVNNNISLFISLLVIGYFVISKRYFLIYGLLLFVYLFIVPINYSDIEWNFLFIMLIIGALSHLILDMVTPAGLKIFRPFSNIELHKTMGIILILLWLIVSVYYVGGNIVF